MSEQNILNPSQTSLFNPDYGYQEGFPETRTLFTSRSGSIFARKHTGLGHVYDLLWNARDLATKQALQQFEEQYLNDFFTLADWERGRYFTGRFAGPLTYSPRGNQAYDIKGQFTEIAGLPMFAYPTNWSRDAIFLEERNGKGEDLVKLTGSGWSLVIDAGEHGGAAYNSATTNDFAEWVYFGYGFQYWSIKQSDRGIVEITCTRQRDGSIVSGPTNVDLYSPGLVNSAALLTVTNLGLDFYRVKVRCTGTKNASSSNFYVMADAIQVMK